MVKAFGDSVRNWKTTTAAILTAITAVSSVAIALLDNDPATIPNYEVAVAAIMAAIGLLFAKDGDK